MRILILGESGSNGAGIPDPSVAWGNRLGSDVAAATGIEPDVVHERFFIWHKGADDYLEQLLERGPFDIVVLSQAKYGFTVWSVDNRIRKVLGNRIGDWFKESVATFDAATRKPGDEGLRRKLNRVAHRSVRKVVGQAPTMSAKDLTARYLKVMARLARLEDTQVIVLGSSDVSAVLARMHPQVVAQTAAFREAIRKDCERRRFGHVDRVALMREASTDHESLFTDGLHKGEEVHRRIALALASEIARHAGTEVPRAASAR